MTFWRTITTAPKDGTPIIVCTHDPREWPFVATFKRVGRYTNSVSAWVGHPFGYMEDRDLYAWMPLPEPPILVKSNATQTTPQP